MVLVTAFTMLQILLCLYTRTRIQNDLMQGCPTRDPRATIRPAEASIWPATPPRKHMPTPVSYVFQLLTTLNEFAPLEHICSGYGFEQWDNRINLVLVRVLG